MWRIKWEKHTPEEASARGRNGVFDPREAELYDCDGTVALNVFSAHHGRNPPMRLRLPPSEALELGKAITELAKGILPKASESHHNAKLKRYYIQHRVYRSKRANLCPKCY